MSGIASIATRHGRNAEHSRHPLPTGIRLCHFTVAHTELKSRSFHRLCLPLARDGVRVSYISPPLDAHPVGIDFSSIPQRSSHLARALRVLPLLRQLLKADAQLYHFADPELLPVALVLKLLLSKRVAYDAYEDFPSMARESGSSPRIWRVLSARLIEFSELLAAHSLDAIITADPFTMRRFAHATGSRKLVFSNFPNLEFFPEPHSPLKSFDVVYRGGLSQRAGTYDLLEAVRLLKLRSKPLRLLLIGYFDDVFAERSLRTRISELGLTSHIELRGRIPHEEMASALSQARIGVCPLRATAKFALNIPAKVFEYWACGLPVIASDLPPIRPYFRTARAGLLFQPGKPNELAEAIEWLLDQRNAAEAMGQNGRAAVVQRFNNCAEISKFEKFLAVILAPRGPKRQERRY